MSEEDQAAPPQAMESEQGEGDKGVAPSSPQQSQQSGGPPLVPIQGSTSPTSSSESSKSSSPQPVQPQPLQPGSVHSQYLQQHYPEQRPIQHYSPPQYQSQFSSSSPSNARYPQVDPRLQAPSYSWYQQQLVLGVHQPRIPYYADRPPAFAPSHQHFAQLPPTTSNSTPLPPRHLPLIAQHQEENGNSQSSEVGTENGQEEKEDRSLSGGAGDAVKGSIDMEEREYGESGSATSYSPQPSSRRTSESSGITSQGDYQQQIPYNFRYAYSQWPPGYPPLAQGYHFQPAPQTGWNHTSPSAQRLPTDAPPLITRPLGGGHPSPVPAPPTYPWSDPSSPPPASGYQPYPLPQASSSASTSQQPLPHIDRRASLPRIPTPERAATQPQQRTSQIPIFGLSTIGGAIPQGGGGGGSSQSGGNNQDEANQSVNPNKGKRMAKPNNAYNIPTIPGVKPFTTKLRYMLQHPSEFDELVCWSEDGECVLVDFGDENLADDLLPRVYGHANPAGFGRQFIVYGFQQLKGTDLSLALMHSPPSIPAASSSNAVPARPPTPPTPRDPETWRAYRHTHSSEELAQALAEEKIIALKSKQQQQEAQKKQKKKEMKVQGKEWNTDDEDSEESEDLEEEGEEEDANWFCVESMTNYKVLARLKPKSKATGGEKRKGGSDAGGGSGGKKAKVSAGGGNLNRMIGGVEVQGLLR